jgi:hypothetical protein
MTSNTHNDKPIYLFVEDKPNGGMIVECSICGSNFDLPNSCGTCHTCPNCNTELIYPEYASW